MKLSQLKHWTQADTGTLPHCIVTSYAGCADYLMEVEYKHHLELLKDEHDETMHFQTLEQVRDLLRPLGIAAVTLRVTDPYDEFSADGQISRCQQDMTIAL
ncbi:DUF6482 family protein [Photobacterium aphoticum]|uniref:Lysyl-tRNA synthetase n=1 Tax=Photobacterium aphoticum TaxID=754436 RepID=A0A0J1JG30_9GAMM|nr:DUF6482 family protein [Photobacterium aphoticum]KLV00772.1 lysyl-tRNA synthetase [Photobacterium aphoticum]PSU53087.1 hypothetical protein C9I90_21220 [Photobacterium aphoticum]GHA51051.1 hypothetical protein GCM10007086_26220 [Photobacterium aphoticum]